MGDDVPGLAFFRHPTPTLGWLQTNHGRPHPADPATLFARIAFYHRTTAEAEATPPVPGSPLAVDDAALGAYPLSHGVSMATGVAMDHLEAIRSLVQDAGVTHPWAEHTLLRAAFESACTALWLIGPDDAGERRHRRLRQVWNDADESRKARTKHNVERPSGRTRDEIEASILALAPDERSVSHWTYLDVVRGAALHIGQQPDFFELVWRAQSGLAHGKSWATLAMLEREEATGASDGEVSIRLTTSVEQLAPAAAMTLNIVRRAWALSETRGRSTGEERISPPADGATVLPTVTS
ncbi:hypothetical protein [Cellulomonas soli]|uniref:hypothetical protein n=1 Tax=Cellulomonas soli TaxID=931535 RepID=UPI0011BF36F5|nr:hypothetical protein [Cellulomonas soli]NYI59141.1 hypothetical protein [Cellulomonas soli]